MINETGRRREKEEETVPAELKGGGGEVFYVEWS